MGEQQNQQFPWQTGAFINLNGRQTGAVSIRDEHGVYEAELPQALFVVMLLLARAAQRSMDQEDWTAKGFVSPRELRLAIKRWTAESDTFLDPDPEHVTRYVHRLRRKLDETTGVAGFGARLIEYRRSFGYRLSTAPGNIRVALTPDDLLDF